MIDVLNGTTVTIIQKSVTIQGQFSEAHISCENSSGLVFGTHPTGGPLNVTFKNLVIHNSRVILFKVCAFNAVITKCRFMNSSHHAVKLLQEKSSALSCLKSTLAVTDSEF